MKEDSVSKTLKQKEKELKEKNKIKEDVSNQGLDNFYNLDEKKDYSTQKTNTTYKRKKELRKKIIGAALVTTGLASLSAIAVKANKLNEGREEIISKFNKSTSEYMITERENGFHIYYTDNQTASGEISIEEFYNYCIESDLTNVEITTGLCQIFSQGVVKNMMGDNYVNFSDRLKEYEVLYEQSLEEVKTNGK